MLTITGSRLNNFTHTDGVNRAVAVPGEGPGGPPPSSLWFLDQTEARRAEKFVWRLPFPLLSKGLDDRPLNSVNTFEAKAAAHKVRCYPNDLTKK